MSIDFSFSDIANSFKDANWIATAILTIFFTSIFCTGYHWLWKDSFNRKKDTINDQDFDIKRYREKNKELLEDTERQQQEKNRLHEKLKEKEIHLAEYSSSIERLHYIMIAQSLSISRYRILLNLVNRLADIATIERALNIHNDKTFDAVEFAFILAGIMGKASDKISSLVPQNLNEANNIGKVFKDNKLPNSDYLDSDLNVLTEFVYNRESTLGEDYNEFISKRPQIT